MSSPTLVYILLVVLLLVVGIIFLYVIIRKARQDSGKKEAQAVLAAGDDVDPSQAQAAELNPYTSNAGLRLSFIKAMKRIRAYAYGKDARYRVPWYLLLGEARSGKTTLLGSTGLNLLFDVPGEKAGGTKQGVNWFFFDQGIVLDVAGDYLLRTDGETSDGNGWNYLNRLLKRYRPERPLDGIILTIPCSDLAPTLNASAEGKRRLELKAQNLYKKLVQAQKTLGMNFPVYVLITKCDKITGFKSFCDVIPEHRDEIFGWSSPYTREIAYRAEWVAEAFQSLYLYLFQIQIEVFAERSKLSNSDDLFKLPSEMRAMRLQLQVYLDRIFKESAYHDPFFLRGIYFCGDSNDTASNGSEPSASSLAQDANEQEIAWLLPPPKTSRPLAATLMPTTTTTPPPPGRSPAFLGHLFERKIFQEELLARPINRTMLSRNRLVLAAQLLSLAIPLVGMLGVLLTYPGLNGRKAEFYKFLTLEKQDLEAIVAERETGVPDEKAQNREARLFEAMSGLSDKGLKSPFIPSSWFSDVNNRSIESISDAYQYVIFESMRDRLNCLTESKLFLPSNAYVACYAALDTPSEQAKPSINCGFDNDPSVSGFIGSLGELMENRRRYDSLIQEHSGSIGDLNKLLLSLHHAPLPSQFDSTRNNIFERALTKATGLPLQSSDMDVKERAACKVKGMIQELYENSLSDKGVSYVYLNDISKAETLLAVQENSWLATRTFDDKRAAFYSLTILAGLGELKRALNDLSKQKFMPKESELAPRTEEAEPEPERQHAARRIVVWDIQLLQQAVALYQDYATFVGNSSYANRDTLDRRVKQAALDSLTNKIEALVKRAYRVQTPQRMVGGSASRANLDMELANFKQAQSLLSKLLDISVTLSRDIHLRGAVEGQTASLLRAIDAEFAAEDFYARSQYKSPEVFFQMWTLDQPFHSYTAFGVSNADELDVYLAEQRTGIAALGRQYAAPVINFIAANEISMRSRSLDWNKLLSQLEKYDNGKPGNTVTVLENFIRVEMNKVTADNCDSLTIESGSSSDYFIQVRNSLRRSFYVRCNELALEKRERNEELARESERWARQKREDDFFKSLESYNEIEKRFNSTLAGRFPFSIVPKTEPFEEAPPEAIEAFFQLLTKNKTAALAALEQCEKYGISPKAAIEFLEEMEQVRLFFASFLEKKPLYPLFDFALKFRVNESNEVGANQIIDWEFGVGKKKFGYQGTETIGNWGYTDPLTLTMRWANNSPTIPSSSGPALSHMKVNGKTVTLAFNNNWSLLLLLLKHRARGTDFDNGVMGVDIEPYTLKFVVPTMQDATLPANIQQAQSKDLRPREVVAFMRVSLMAPSKKDPLILPDKFPEEAPKLTNRRAVPYQSSGQE